MNYINNLINANANANNIQFNLNNVDINKKLEYSDIIYI